MMPVKVHVCVCTSVNGVSGVLMAFMLTTNWILILAELCQVLPNSFTFVYVHILPA